MGDPSKILLLEKVVEVVKRDNLLNLAQESGNRFITPLCVLLL
jgi:4-aminobutyrate aminotransferase/(S)-3-amino-2-methylpropionate transaminase